MIQGVLRRGVLGAGGWGVRGRVRVGVLAGWVSCSFHGLEVRCLGGEWTCIGEVPLLYYRSARGAGMGTNSSFAGVGSF